MSINVTKLGRAITRELQIFNSDVEKGLEKAKEDVSKMGVQELKAGGDFKNRTGKYRKGWRVKKEGTNYIIHNATDYQLTHLLERGHALKGGGRAQAYPHIAPTESDIIDEYEKKVKEYLR